LPISYSQTALTKGKLLEKLKDKDFQIRPNLTINVEYRGVNKEVWELLSKFYGGGPPIIRDSLNIYGKDMTKEANIKNRNAFFEIIAPLSMNKEAGKTMNIFAKKERNSQDKPKKKRNLFVSENIMYEDDDVPEELPEANNLQNMGVIQPAQQPGKNVFLSQKVEQLLGNNSPSLIINPSNLAGGGLGHNQLRGHQQPMVIKSKRQQRFMEEDEGN